MTNYDVWDAPFDAARPAPPVNVVAENAVFAGLTFDDFLSIIRTNGLPPVTENTALSMGAVYACVALIAGSIGSIPMTVHKRDQATGETEEIYNDPLWWVFNEEWSPRWLAPHGWEFFVMSLLLRGNAFVRIMRSGASVRGLVPIHPDRVEVLIDTVADRLVYVVQPETIGSQVVGTRLVIDQDDMIHVAGLGFDGRLGMSPLKHHLRNTVSLAIATQDYAARFFANQARPDYVLQTDKTLESSKVEELREQIRQKYSGGANSHLPMILHSGLTANTLGMDIEEIQLLGTRQFDIEEIARLFRTPPFMIGHTQTTTAWGTGIESLGKAFVRYTLRPVLGKIQTEFNRKIFRTAAKLCRFDTTELERADFKTLIESFRAGLGRAGEQAIYEVEEVRRALGLPKRPHPETHNPGATDAPPPTEPAQ